MEFYGHGSIDLQHCDWSAFLEEITMSEVHRIIMEPEQRNIGLHSYTFALMDFSMALCRHHHFANFSISEMSKRIGGGIQ